MKRNIKQYVNPTGLSRGVGPYSYGVIAESGKWLYISGMTGRNGKGDIVEPGDVKTQAEQCVKNIKMIVEESGGDLQDVVKLTIYIKDWSKYHEVSEIRRQYWTEPYPASTTVAVPEFKSSDLVIEIDAIVAL